MVFNNNENSDSSDSYYQKFYTITVEWNEILKICSTFVSKIQEWGQHHRKKIQVGFSGKILLKLLSLLKQEYS